VEKWEGSRLDFRSAVAAQTTGAAEETFGVIWVTARTEVNREARTVALEDIRFTRSNFPTLAGNGASYREQQSRSQIEDRVNRFSQGERAARFSTASSGGGWGDHPGGGFGDRFGEGSRSGGGGIGGARGGRR
jgi:hypothetical protein